VSVRDASGTILAESRHAPLAAPAELKPKITVVRFPGIAFRPGLKVSVRQDGEEITDANNEVELR